VVELAHTEMDRSREYGYGACAKRRPYAQHGRGASFVWTTGGPVASTTVSNRKFHSPQALLRLNDRKMEKQGLLANRAQLAPFDREELG
jgi:hypothetical protein